MKKHTPQVFILPKNLTRELAFKMAKSKSKRDFRGFTYNPKTGRASLI